MMETATCREKVEAKIRKWDDEVDDLEPETRSAYEGYRDMFRRRMNVWVERAKVEHGEFTNYIEDDFEKLETHWNRIKTGSVVE